MNVAQYIISAFAVIGFFATLAAIIVAQQWLFPELPVDRRRVFRFGKRYQALLEREREDLARAKREDVRLRVENERLSKSEGDLLAENARLRVKALKDNRRAYELGREEGRLRAEGRLP